MPITHAMRELANAFREKAESKADHSDLAGVMHDAMCEAGYELIAKYHFGDGRKAVCQPKDYCMVITSILRGEEDTLNLWENWYAKAKPETNIGEYEALMLIETYKTTRKKA